MVLVNSSLVVRLLTLLSLLIKIDLLPDLLLISSILFLLKVLNLVFVYNNPYKAVIALLKLNSSILLIKNFMYLPCLCLLILSITNPFTTSGLGDLLK